MIKINKKLRLSKLGGGGGAVRQREFLSCFLTLPDPCTKRSTVNDIQTLQLNNLHTVPAFNSCTTCMGRPGIIRSSNSIVGYAVVYILRLIGHTHDRESPIQNFSTAPKKLGAHISSPVWSPKPTEFVPYLVNLRCDALTALKSVQSARNESFLAGSDNFHCVHSAI